jgi:hypothetical protein
MGGYRRAVVGMTLNRAALALPFTKKRCRMTEGMPNYIAVQERK